MTFEISALKEIKLDPESVLVVQVPPDYTEKMYDQLVSVLNHVVVDRGRAIVIPDTLSIAIKTKDEISTLISVLEKAIKK